MAKYRDMRFASWAKREFNWDIQPKLEEIAVDDSRIDLSFSAQRPLDDQRASQMAECFIPPLAAGINMAELPNGRLVFMDGQHRWKAAVDAGMPTIWVLLFKMTWEQASAFFRLKNGLAIVLVRHIESTRAGDEAKDPYYTDMQVILHKHECFLDREYSHKEGGIIGSFAVDKIYSVDHGDLLDATLATITETWGHGHNVLIAPILEGMALFIAHHQEELRTSDLRDLKVKLAKKGFESFWAEAKASFRRVRGSNQSSHVEQEIVVNFNSHRTSRRLPDRTARLLAQLPDLAHLAAAYSSTLPSVVQPTLEADQEVG